MGGPRPTLIQTQLFRLELSSLLPTVCLWTAGAGGRAYPSAPGWSWAWLATHLQVLTELHQEVILHQDEGLEQHRLDILPFVIHCNLPEKQAHT